MSRMLSELLGATEPLFSLGLRELEQASGRPNVDIRLTTEIKNSVTNTINELGLDPQDTSGPELYAALQAKVRSDDIALARAIGVANHADTTKLLPAMIKAIKKLDIPKDAWVIKASVVKRLLKKMPPKNTMKLLGYKSVDSMLKREQITELYGAMRFTESVQWLHAFHEQYRHLTPSDFEIKAVDIKVMQSDRWEKLARTIVFQRKHNIIFFKELGVIVVLPMPITKLQGYAITVMPLLIHYVYEIRMYSAYFKLHQVRPDFGVLIARSIDNSEPHTITVAGQPIQWRAVQRYYGHTETHVHPEVFEPHVQAEDLSWQHAEAILCDLVPELAFWQGLDYIGKAEKGRTISCNLIDVAINYCNELPYDKSVCRFMQDALWNEMYRRYMSQENFEREVLSQIDSESYDRDFLEMAGEL